MIKRIKPNIDLWISSEPSPESLQIVWNFVGWMLSALYVNQTNLKVKLRRKLGANRGPAKNLGDHGPPRPHLRTTIVVLSLLC